ncbi:hypothetical protein DL767_010012 [Monosporascus sp. MG133]|nr:hypothetical protein DL767_010012 [Monosporascus sp. MG133]
MASTAVLLGSTGLLGHQILSTLLTLDTYQAVHTISRRLPKTESPKLSAQIEADTTKWPPALSSLSPTPSIVISSLGTTRVQAGGVANQGRIDHDLNIELAKAAHAAGVETYLFGVDDAIRDIGFEQTIIMRPGAILGKREVEHPGGSLLNTAIRNLGRISQGWQDGLGQDANLVGRAAAHVAILAQQGRAPSKYWVVGQADVQGLRHAPPMRPAGYPLLLPPTSSLPALRSLNRVTEDELAAALRNLYALYCPLPPSFAFHQSSSSERGGKYAGAVATTAKGSSTPIVVDSGYVSGNEDEDEDRGDDDGDHAAAAESLRADPFERSFAERWLTGFIARSEELTCFSTVEALERAVEHASCVLSSFFASTAAEEERHAEETAQIAREFSFDLFLSPAFDAASITAAVSDEGAKGSADAPTTTTTTAAAVIKVRLNDGLAGASNDDHTDVGLQSWGASIVFSELLCAAPERFLGRILPTKPAAETDEAAVLPSSNPKTNPRIVELGAGTGLVSLVLAAALPRLGVSHPSVIATDYHPAVLANLRANIEANFPAPSSSSLHPAAPVIDVCALDWSAPSPGPPLDEARTDVLVATDVVYAPDHAAWLRDCAARLLAPAGVFWLVATVRPNGKFAGISDTVRAAFAAVEEKDRPVDGHRLAILGEEWIEKRRGVGRGDESGAAILTLSGFTNYRLLWTLALRVDYGDHNVVVDVLDALLDGILPSR